MEESLCTKELMNLLMSNLWPWKNITTAKISFLAVRYNYKVKYNWHNNILNLYINYNIRQAQNEHLWPDEKYV